MLIALAAFAAARRAESVVGIDIRARTQNGHIRNDTRDVSRRMKVRHNRLICRRTVPRMIAMVRRGSAVRVRQRA